MDRDLFDQLELEHGDFCGGSDWTDGGVVEQERVQVQKGIWGKISEKDVHNDSWDLVDAGCERLFLIRVLQQSA